MSSHYDQSDTPGRSSNDNEQGDRFRPQFSPRQSEGDRGGFRSSRPEGDRGGFRSSRPEGDRGGFRSSRPEGDRGGFRSSRPEGDRGGFRSSRPEGDRDGFRSSRPEGDRGGFRSSRPEGDRGGFRSSRPEGDRGGFRSSRPEGDRGGFRSSRPEGDRGGFRSSRPEGDRGGFRSSRPEGDRGGFRSSRPEGDRDGFRSSRPEGDRGGFRSSRPDFRGSLPEDNRDSSSSPSTEGSQDSPRPGADRGGFRSLRPQDGDSYRRPRPGGDRDGYRRARPDGDQDEFRRARLERFSADNAPEGSEQWVRPWVQLKYYPYNSSIPPRMLGAASPDALAGELINVYDKEGELFGGGFWNPTSRTPLRLLTYNHIILDEAALEKTLENAVNWRRKALRLDEQTNAYRLIHSDGDGIGGLTVDRYADMLSLEVTNLGVWKRLDRWLSKMHAWCGTSRHVIKIDPSIARMEGINIDEAPISEPVRMVRIEENGIKFELDFSKGQKPNFFSEQRENRLKLSKFVEGKTVLDLCCHIGGFAIQAKVQGKASEVTAVDLSERAITMAKRNANINQNQHRIDFIQADAFVYARQMVQNAKTFDVVILDPSTFISGIDEAKEEGVRRYNDLNKLALQCVSPGGLFLTCSYSGLLSPAELEHIVFKVAQRQGRRLQVLESAGSIPDFPFISTYSEARHLKFLWVRVLD